MGRATMTPNKSEIIQVRVRTFSRHLTSIFSIRAKIRVKEKEIDMKPSLPIALLALVLAGSLGTLAHAQTNMAVDTSGTAFASYDPFTANAGPFPASNFGVAVSASLGGNNVDLALGGNTNFLFPAFSNGQVLLPLISNVNVGYTPGWTGSLTSTSNFSANATFQANVGPFSASDNLFSQNLNAIASGNLASGGNLAGGNSSGTANGSLFHYTYTASALVASASASINVGANYQNSLSWSPTTQYGMYSWLSATKNQGPTGTPQFTSGNSGALNYTVQDFGSALAGKQVYLNFEPGVNFGMAVTPSSNLSTPITGNLSAEAFGDTLVNYNFPIATPFNLPVNYGEWDVNGQWNSGFAFSVPVMEEDLQQPGQCLDPRAQCLEFVVDGEPFEFSNALATSGPAGLTNGFGSGSWSSGVSGAPLLPGACDPVTGQCYASNDPNMPVGTATITSSLTQVTAPEPGGLSLLLMSLATIIFVGRRRNGFATGKTGQV